MIPAFVRAELRARDPDAARGFYQRLLGYEPRISRLPERAVARGAPPHWLGHVAVAEPAAVAARFFAAGGAPLGPPQADGTVVLRDPFGAVLALCPPADGDGRVAWHDLHVADRARALALYGEILGWRGREDGRFAWSADGPPVGAVYASATSPEVHPHWAFHFAVDDLDAALALVRASGGVVIRELTLDDGTRVAPCEDPEGAELALRSTVG